MFFYQVDLTECTCTLILSSKVNVQIGPDDRVQVFQNLVFILKNSSVYILKHNMLELVELDQENPEE